MLRIILYKGCKVNDKYEEVFSLGKLDGSTISVFQSYLQTLDDEMIEIDNVYYENEGELVFSNILSSKNIYSFNYMKITQLDDDNKIVWERYCFIKEIKIKYDCVYLSYKEDIWHSYSNEILGINNSFLSNTRVKNYNNFTPKLLKLPLDYDGNNPLVINHMQQFDKYYAIVQIQFYQRQTGSTTATEPRKTKYCLLSDYLLRPNNEFIPFGQPKFSFNEIIERVNNIANASYVYKGKFSDKLPDTSELLFNYEIGEIYIIPGYFNININVPVAGGVEGAVIFKGLIQTLPILEFLPLLSETLPLSIFGEEINLFSLPFDDDYRDLSVGTFNNQIKLIHNGTKHNLKISYIFSDSNLSILLNLDNQVIDISNDFIYEFPYDVISSDEYANRARNYYLKKLNLLVSAYTYGEKWLSGTYNAVSGSAQAIVGGINPNSETGKSNYGQMIKGIDKVFEGKSEQRQALVGLGKTFIEYYALSGYSFSNAKGTFNVADNIRNQIHGILKFAINPDNAEFVKSVRDKYGFFTYEFINDIEKLDFKNPQFFINNNINYNVVKFVNANVYGKFTNAIADDLNAILNNGFRIWYNVNLQEDNYDI